VSPVISTWNIEGPKDMSWLSSLGYDGLGPCDPDMMASATCTHSVVSDFAIGLASDVLGHGDDDDDASLAYGEAFCCTNGGVSGDECGTCNSFMSRGSYCDDIGTCSPMCGGDWCSGYKPTTMPSVKPLDPNEGFCCFGGGVGNEEECGVCDDFAARGSWCFNPLNCAGCAGTWCAGHPTSEPTIEQPTGHPTELSASRKPSPGPTQPSPHPSPFPSAPSPKPTAHPTLLIPLPTASPSAKPAPDPTPDPTTVNEVGRNAGGGGVAGASSGEGNGDSGAANDVLTAGAKRNDDDDSAGASTAGASVGIGVSVFLVASALIALHFKRHVLHQLRSDQGRKQDGTHGETAEDHTEEGGGIGTDGTTETRKVDVANPIHTETVLEASRM